MTRRKFGRTVADVMLNSDAVRTFRLRGGHTQVELAELAGLSEMAINKIETGRTASPRPGTVRKLADALGVEIRELEAAS